MTDLLTTDLDVERWLDDNWAPDLTVRAWWQRLADARLAAPMLPPPYGRRWGREQTVDLVQAMTRRGALGPPSGIGMMLAVPTLLAHGSPDLVADLVPRILDGSHGWCQLFSEPGAGSDLAGLQTRAERDGDQWVITGQKVWTSTGQYADYGILIARTDPDVPKHRGITYFAFPMRQRGVEVRPLREMTGRSIFNEVFLDGARVPHANVIGEVGDGWRVANTTLMVERMGIGGATVAAPSAAVPGTVAGDLDRSAGSFGHARPIIDEGMVSRGRVLALIELARQQSRLGDATVRQDLARLYSLVEIGEWHLGRMKAGNAATGGEGNLAKLRNSAVTRLARDLAARILGMHATLVGPDTPGGGTWQELVLFSPAPSIFGGTDQIQRNVVGERVLGLPKEPGPPSDAPFRALPQNTVPAAAAT